MKLSKLLRLDCTRCLLVLILFQIAPAGIADGSERFVPDLKLLSPYWGEPRSHSIPLEGKPTLVVHVDPAVSLVPMDLIRILRSSSGARPGSGGATVKIAVVLIGQPQGNRGAVDWANQQRSLLDTGLKARADYISLWDEKGEWYEKLGRPQLPYAILVGADGRILAEQVFVGSWDWEVGRMEALIQGRSGPHPESDAGQNAETLPDDWGVDPLPITSSRSAYANVDEQGYDSRTNVEAIINLLEQRFAPEAPAAVQEFCSRTIALSMARRFAQSALSRWGIEKTQWAQQLIDTNVEGRVSASAYALEVMTTVENASPTHRMYFELDAKLISRWDNRQAAHTHHTYIVKPGSSFTSFLDSFKRENAGWGDYLVECEYKVTMDTGRFPDTRRCPTHTVHRKEHVTYFPEAGAYVKDEAAPAPSTAAGRALKSMLAAQHRTILIESREAQAEDSLADGGRTWLRRTAERAATAVQSTWNKATGPQAHRGRTFTALPVASWIGLPADGANKSLSPPRGDTLEARPGRVTLVDFMFTTCGPCLAALPKLSSMSVELKKRGLDVISVAPGWGSGGLRNLIDRNDYQQEFAVLQKDAEQAYGVKGYPTYLLIDRKGVICSVTVGGAPPAEEIERLLKEP